MGRLLRAEALREFVRLAAEAAIVGVLASAVLLFAALFIAEAAHAATSAAPGTGTLLLRGPADTGIPAPLVATDVQVQVVGAIARTRVMQRFVNPGSDWREGVYLFPLPESAAVDHLDMRIGARVIAGEIRERAAARRDYDLARQEGRKAALVEQERANLFTTSVAPIGPGEEITVAIEYQESLRFDAGRYSLRFPMAITARYSPPARTGGAPDAQPANPVNDAARIGRPTIDPAQGKGLPVTLDILIDPGFPLAAIDSRFHAVDVEEAAGNRYRVRLSSGPVPADRDFELTFAPDVGAAPGAAVFGETRDDGAYALIMLVPPAAQLDAVHVPREVTFIIDTSGSMAGTSIVQAKAALGVALSQLQGGDRFNVIAFSSQARALFAEPVPVDPATLAQAQAFAARLHASGGTEMREALELALAPGAAEGFVRQVVFLTDGAVGNEDALFALIRERLGDRRLFTIGIGSAPNGHFMRKAAQFGRGTFTSIGDAREVAERMAALFVKLRSPVLTDIVIDWPAGATAWPQAIPDLHAGEPIVATARFAALSGEVALRGRRNGRPWHATLPLATTGGAQGVGVLWARAAIDALEDARIEGADAESVRAKIVRIALDHHLVSRHTSLVAVDVEATMIPGTPITRTRVPGNTPAGQEFEVLVAGLPQTASPAARSLLIALMAMLMAAALFAIARTGAGAWLPVQPRGSRAWR